MMKPDSIWIEWGHQKKIWTNFDGDMGVQVVAHSWILKHTKNSPSAPSPAGPLGKTDHVNVDFVLPHQDLLEKKLAIFYYNIFFSFHPTLTLKIENNWKHFKKETNCIRYFIRIVSSKFGVDENKRGNKRTYCLSSILNFELRIAL